MKAVDLARHNEVVAATHRRIADMESRYAHVVQRILEQLALDAASAFEEYVHDHMVAAARRRGDARAFGELGLKDVADLRGVFASLALTASAPGVESTTTMIALYPRPEQAAALEHAAPGEPAELLHVTLAYLGDTEGPLTELVDALRNVAVNHAPLSGKVGGIGAFDDNGSGYPGILLPDVPGLVELRQALCAAVTSVNGEGQASEHGFTPHITVAYNDDDLTFPSRDMYGQPLNFDSIHLVRADEHLAVIPLVGARTVLAAGDGDPTPWTPPAANEVIDVAAVVAALRTKTDPVRQALIANVMGEMLKGSGIDFDATNPFAARVLEQSGSQIVSIAETTQLNVMRIIAAAWDQGLTIPDTAKAIRVGMREASPARATLIARTELVGAGNGGSLAAAQIVESATGDSYRKQWNTADGAMFPRHEEYEGLDGQTVNLDEAFDVGGVELLYPGDPDGPPDEVCNCRCALSYV